MSTPSSKPSVPQATAFRRFTIRLVDGRFVRVPKPDLPSVEPQVDQSATSNQTEVRDLFRLVNGRFVSTRPDPTAPRISPRIPIPERHGPDPTFDLPGEPRLPARHSSFIQEDP